MTKREKRRFIRELISAVQKSILDRVPDMPEEWDGHELRAYIAEKFGETVVTVGRTGHYGKPYAKRTRDYRNTVIERNL
ncbi:hypothetical protein KEU06_09350 [Pseudaminobacter sp. 19-2017]|uniref:Transposase n=1 Tax=Pseudaminobacter soli (ex Zhang et al. 2022) TaxID=2831468 RepID=A0A942E1C9_9HYPH|nr:hypothetical protein [Pseudaminobacter soli]MBS3648810.1 hypothetical protein [Pseudaminobacter soli]